jgi:hypothetical protein
VVSYRKNSRVNTGGFPEKVISIAKYDIELITSLHMKPSNKMTIERGAANVVATYFEYYLDTKARSNPEKFHHVYEFDKTGDADRRLFKKNLSSTAEGAIISFSFKPAKRPNREGYLFSNKASIMESGETVIVKPKSSKYLMYRVDETGIFVKTSKPSVIRYPGGQYVKGAFKNEFENFTSGQAKIVLKEYRYFDKIASGIKKTRSVVVSRINKGNLSSIASQAGQDASKIAQMTAVV